MWENTLLARRWRQGVYVARNRDGDRPLVSNMQLVEIDRPDLYTYVVHGGNVWNTPHFESMFSLTESLDPVQVAEVKANLGIG